MTTHLRTKGLSRRAYARLRGCSEAAVRQAITDGRLKPALLPDGSLDAAKADKLLAKSTIAAKETPAELTDARHRKLRAQCALLRDEIEALEKSFISQEEDREARLVSSKHVAAKLHAMVDGIVPHVVGVIAAEAADVVQKAVYVTLTDLAQTVVLPSKGPSRKTRQRGLAGMNGTELAALKATLQARRMELEANRREHALVRLADVGQDVTARFLRIRAKLLAMHHRLAPALQGVGETEARQVLIRAVEEVIEELVSPMVPREALGLRRVGIDAPQAAVE